MGKLGTFDTWVDNLTTYKDHNLRLLCDNPDVTQLNREILLGDAIEVNGEAITKMDLFSIRGMDDKKIEEFIVKNTGIDLNTKEGINRINELFFESTRFYEEYLYRRLSKTFNEHFHNGFKNKKEVIAFLKRTVTCASDKQIYCSVAKIIYAMNDLLNNEKLIDLDNKAKRFIKKTFRGLQIFDSNFPDLINETGGVYSKKMKSGEFRTIPFNLVFRGKGEYSSTLKMINEPKERLDEVIKDNIGIQFEVHNRDDAVFLLEYIFINIFNKDVKEFRQKKFLDEEQIGEILLKYGDDLDTVFLEALLGLQCESKPKNNQNYSDVKFNGDVEIKDSDDEKSISRTYGAEIRCVLVDNNNESGLSDHRILDGLKKIFAVVRLQGYVSEPYIFRVSKKIIDDSEKNKKEDSITISHEKIFNYYISKMYKFVIDKGTKIPFYTTPNRWNALSGTTIYPKEVHFAKSNDGKVDRIKKS